MRKNLSFINFSGSSSPNEGSSLLPKNTFNRARKNPQTNTRDVYPKSSKLLYGCSIGGKYKLEIHLFLDPSTGFCTAFMRWFLENLNMLPVYRVRDGMSSVTKNNAIFERCIRMLKKLCRTRLR